MKFLMAFVATFAVIGSAQAEQAISTAPGDDEATQTLALNPVVITAQKRQQQTQDVPISMTVLSQDDLEKARGGTLEDIQQLVPNFSMESQSGYNVLTMRGIGGGGRNIGFDPRVGVYLDGIYMGQAQALRQPLFDIEQVEILRGPQGHLFGRNTVAGAVNITSRSPTKELEGYLRSVMGSKGTREGYATISGPISETVLGKISLASESHDGFTKNIYDGNTLDDLGRTTARGQLVFIPTDKLKISLSADWSRTKQNLILGEPTNDLFGQPVLAKRTVNFNTTPSENISLSGGSATVNYRMGSGYIVTAITGYRSTHHEKRVDNDYSPNNILGVFYIDDFRQSSEELRIASPNEDSLRYVAGLYHLSETATTNRKATFGLMNLVISNNGEVNTNTSALFGALDYDITHALTLNLGARYTHETKDVLFNLAGSAIGLANLTGYQDTRLENNMSPTVGASYAVSPRLNVYAKYSRGFKSGGWNTDYLDVNAATKPSFDTETVNSYEVGTKGKLLNDRLRYNLAAYTSQNKNFQVFQFVTLAGGSTSILLKNAAEVESHGIDADLTLRATQRLDIGVNFGLSKATFKRFDSCSPTVNCTGNHLPYAPNFTSSLTVNYGMPLARVGGKLNIYGEYSYHGKSFADPINDPVTLGVPSRELVNIRLGYIPNNSHWDFNLWAKNLFNKDTVVMRNRDFLGSLTDRRVDPRVVGMEAQYSFY